MSSIKARIAALNLEEVHAPSPGVRPAYSYDQAEVKKKKPPPPPLPAKRTQTTNNPPILSNGISSAKLHGNQPEEAPNDPPKVQMQPALPPRPNSRAPAPTPPLPPRKSSERSIRTQASSESISTIASANSVKTSMSANGASLYHIRAPAYDPAKLPPIFPKKIPKEDKESSTLKAMKSKSTLAPDRALPPQLPTRPPLPTRNGRPSSEAGESSSPVKFEARQTIPAPRRSALSFGLNKSTELPPPLPTSRPSTEPPPVPLSSRPNLQAIMASKPRPGAQTSCLKCRDFSGPDNHAAQFPRRNLPGSDVSWLSTQLTAPFSSNTDKARAIFTWLHHNIEYDVDNFFKGTIAPSTPESTITSGLAVCEGYARLFHTLALKSGLQAVVVTGHGKGFGHSPLKPGDPIPPAKPDGHAWNAVQIDGGEWKLIDPCWGAGHLGCQLRNEGYQKSFNSNMFTMSNEDFGKRHFPADNRYFFRSDGRALPWEEYCLDDAGERVVVYSNAFSDHGIDENSFQPSDLHIKVYDASQGPTIRFQFATICPHWDNERHGKGKPYVMCLSIGGRDGRNSDYIPFETNGNVWWLDIARIELGAPGQKVSLYALTHFDGRDARGLSCSEYKARKGRVAYQFAGVAMWELI